MDLTWTPEDAAFRLEVREWLEANVPHQGVSAYGGLETIGPLSDWERALRDAGYCAVSWPVEYGGAGFNELKATIFNEEYDRVGAPRRLNYPALGLLGPTLMLAGTPRQREELLPRSPALRRRVVSGVQRNPTPAPTSPRFEPVPSAAATTSS